MISSRYAIAKRFKASPLTPFEYLLAQMVSRILVLVLSASLVFWIGYWINPFPMTGSLIDLLVLFTLGSFCHAAMGLIIAARFTSDEFANGVLNVITYPMMFLSEIWFSLEGSPGWVKTLASYNPLWHLTDGMRKIMFEGVSLHQLNLSLLVFLVVSVCCLAFGSLMFRWTAEK